MDWLVALVLGAVQGVLEWLPVSSEGTIALVLTALDVESGVATRLALFLHAGTAVAAAAYFRAELQTLLGDVPNWRPDSAFAETADLSFFAVATLVSSVVGLAGYTALSEIASAVAGGGFVALIGGLLVATGLFMRVAESRARTVRKSPTLLDAILVGTLQGLAVLPGVSRSGTTVSALLLRGHDGPASLRLSFVLSIPAAAGAGLLAVLDGGLAAIDPATAVLTLAVSAGVGYLTVDALVRVVERVAFWRICVGFGGLAVLGGGLLLV